MTATATALLAELVEVAGSSWARPVADVAELRKLSLPPMGTMPCVLYCNFDLFWLTEQLQVLRQSAVDGIEAGCLGRIAGRLIERSADRVGKWGMPDTVAMLRRAAAEIGAATFAPGELVAVLEQLMVVVNRVQSAIDAIIPWAELDARLSLHDCRDR